MAAPLECRDMRSTSLPFKRDRDHNAKWAHGARPSAGVRRDICAPLDDPNGGLIGGNEGQRAKVRPYKQHSQLSHHSDKLFSNGSAGMRGKRIADAADGIDEAQTGALSNSLLDLLPQYNNNSNSGVKTALLAKNEGDNGVLYSYEKVSSPGSTGRQVDLAGLVDLAEKKWVNEQTEKIIHGEYEVLDNEGETTVLTKGKGKKSPKQRAAKAAPAKADEAVEVDGFELI